ncbi:coiled-coil domain-containing protein 151 [Anguilla anguilla]|uniref:coiled-coil domain-containing protein 151 n=1 Tax=Anguilla anguilla TaxID=7936 RepID=UPI0015A78D33|nr:coiled-coil domain-containing protein 151 [Anguilla anguilla]
MPGPFEFEGIKPSLRDGADLQRKIQLLEGDRSAYYESSQSAIKKNKDVILQLRQENKRLHKKLADALTGDEQVIKDAFQSRGMEIAPFRNKSGKAALQILDQKVCDRMKKLNALRHSAETRRRRLEELQQQYDSIQAQAQAPQPDATRREEDAQNLRVLENRLEKAQLKCQEAEHIMRSYLKLKAHLQDESLTFQSQLDRLEAEILRQRQELQDLQVMKNDANLSKDVARAELQRQEELVYKERRERDGILACYKKQAEELKAHSERLERRAQRTAMHPDELSSEAQRSAAAVAEEDKVIHTFEEAFHRIKEATGVTDTHEVVERFISQGDTQKHLEKLKEENERTLVQLKEERDQLQAQFQELKYSGEAKLSSGQQMVEECEGHLQREQEKRDEASERLEALTRTLNAVRAGVDHLSDKLQHIKMKGKPSKTQVSPSSDEYALELLTQSELRLASLVDLLQGKDLAAVLKEMEEEEFQTSIEGKLPQYNMRIQLPEAQKQGPYDEEEESGDDEGDIITRAALKRQSQIIIDSKTKRKTRTKKKKGKP